MSYAEQWKKAKKQFETVTGKSKPTEKVLGFFRKSSGLENATKALDEAIKKDTEALLNKAATTFDTAKQTYIETLSKAVKESKDTNYLVAVNQLGTQLQKIGADFTETRAANKQKFCLNIAKQFEKVGLEVQELVKQAQQDQELAEGQASDCSTALREVLAAAANSDLPKAQKLVVICGERAKSIGELQKRVVKAHQIGRVKVDKTVESLDLERFKKDRPEGSLRDKCEMLLDKLEMMAGELEEVSNEAKKEAKEAVVAAKGGADSTKIYVSGIRKLASRAIKAFSTLDATERDVGGAIDSAGLDVINSGERNDPSLLEKARGDVKNQKPRVAAFLKGLERLELETTRELATFPESAQSDGDFAESYAEVRGLLTKDLPELQVKARALSTKLSKLEAKLK